MPLRGQSGQILAGRIEHLSSQVLTAPLSTRRPLAWPRFTSLSRALGATDSQSGYVRLVAKPSSAGSVTPRRARNARSRRSRALISSHQAGAKQRCPSWQRALSTFTRHSSRTPPGARATKRSRLRGVAHCVPASPRRTGTRLTCTCICASLEPPCMPHVCLRAVCTRSPGDPAIQGRQSPCEIGIMGIRDSGFPGMPCMPSRYAAIVRHTGRAAHRS